MVNVVLAVAVVGVALLAAAVLTENTIVAIVVIVVAVVGLVLLARDWLRGREQAPQPAEPRDGAQRGTHEQHPTHEEGIEPDEFEPDVPFEDDAGDARDTPAASTDDAGDERENPLRDSD